MTTPQLLVVGFSARAAAGSAVRAGYRASAIDAFADADLVAFCQAVRDPSYPQGLVSLAAGFPAASCRFHRGETRWQ
jgi:hypothetical protein